MPLDDAVKSELNDYFTEKKKTDATALRTSLTLASSQSPDEAAKVKNLSRSSGIPANLVKINQLEIERQESVKEDKMKRLVESYPLLSKQLLDPEFAKISYDETHNLSMYEKAAKGIGEVEKLGRAFAHGAFGEGIFGSGLEGLGMNISNYWKLAEIAPDVFLGTIGTAGRLPGVDLDFETKPGENIEKAGAAIREFSEKNIKPEGPYTKPMQVAGGLGQGASQIGAMMIPGMGNLSLALMMGQGTKAQSDKIERDSPHAPEQLKAMEELTGGFITGATEAITNKFMIGLGKAKYLSSEINILKSKMFGYTGRILAGATSEAIQETAENVFQDLAHIAFTTPEAEVEWNAAVESGEVGAWVGGIMTAVLNAAFHVKGRGFRNSIAEVNDAAKNQKLKERSPEEFKTFGGVLAKHLADTSNGIVDTLYIDKGAFAQAVTNAGSKVEDVASTIPGIQEQFIESEATGNDIAIKMEDFLGKIAGTEIGDAISPHIRASEKSLSYTEQQEIPEIAKKIEEQANQIIEKQTDQKAFETSVREVEKGVYTQLKEAGAYSPTVNRAYSKFISSFYTTLAGKYNSTPSEMYAKIPYKIKSTGEVSFDSATVLSQTQKEKQKYPTQDPPIYGDADYKKRGGKIFQMSPDQFLKSSKPLKIDAEVRESVDILKDHIKSGKKLDPANLYVENGKVFDHDGRHRALAAKELGIAKLPVLVLDKNNKKIDAQIIDQRGKKLDLIGAQTGQEAPLFVTHNLSAENIIAANKLGGLAAPSIAVARADISNFEGFGEVSLLAESDLLTSAKARVFDADIYSPRQPRAHYKINRGLYNELSKAVDEDVKLDFPSLEDLEDTDGPRNFAYSQGVKYHWLKLQGKAPKIKKAKIDKYTKRAAKLASGYRLLGDPKFINIATEYYQEKIDTEEDTEKKEFIKKTFFEDGKLNINLFNDFAYKVRNYKQDGGLDLRQLRQDIDKKFRNKKTDNEYEAWAEESFNELVTGEKMFKGYTDSGNRRYTDYTMQNVIKEMTQKLQAGEGFFYGAGSVRSAYTKELKTIKQIQAKRNDIITEKDFEVIKKESGEVLTDALEKLKPFYKYDTESFGYFDDAGNAIVEGRKGINEAFNSTEESDKIISDLVDYLVNLPTTYFEAKIQRPVGLEEFHTAVVPDDINPKALEILKNAGLKIKKYGKKKARNEVISGQTGLFFQQNLDPIETEGTFSSTDPNIYKQELRGAFDPAQLTTLLNTKADFSTFLHETAHFYLEAYTRLSIEPNAPQDIKDDMKTMLNWFGVESMEQWSKMDVPELRKFHEQFAYNFEIYLAEGKASSPEMLSVFDRFASWLRSIYKNIKEELNVLYKNENGEDLPVLTKDVTQVMDRMLASEEQIKQVEATRNLEPLFKSQELSGMTDDQWSDYQKEAERSHNESVRDLQTSTVRQIKWLENAKSKAMKQLQKKGRATRAKVSEKIAQEIGNQPIYKAINFLKKGEITTEDGEVQVQDGNKLNIEEVRKIYEGRETLEGVPNWKKLGFGPNGMLAKDGLLPDLVADMFGFRSGDILVRSIIDTRSLKEAVEEATDREMLEKYSNISSTEEMEIQVNKAINTKARAKFVAIELNHLSKSMRPVRVMTKAAQTAAQQMIGAKSIKDIKAGTFNTAAAKSAAKAESAMKKGDTQTAIIEKQKQLLNIHLAKEATKARVQVAKSLNLYKSIFKPDKKLAVTRDMNFVSTARAILANYGIGPKLASAETFLENIEKYDPELMAEIKPMIIAHREEGKNYKDMKLNEFLDMHDQVDALWHLSKRSKQMLIDGKIIQRNDAVDILVAKAEEIGLPKNRPGYKSDMSDWDKRKIMLLSAKASLRRVESWVSAMDRADTGPFRKYIWQPISEAISEFRLAKIGYLEKYMEAIKTVDFGKGKVDAKEIGYTFKDKTTLLHSILHTGNESNKRKLLLGRGWASLNEDGTINDDKWNRFLNRMHEEGILTKKDYDFAQGVWDLLESMKPDAQKVHRELYGFYFNEITAEPFSTPFGEYKGGYIPAVTDPYVVTESAVHREQETQQVDNSYMFPTTGRGFSKSRVEYNMPLQLDLGYLPSHIDKVLRFTHIEPRIKDVARVVKNSPTFGETMDRLDSTIRIDMLIPWLQRSAQQIVQTPMKSRLLHTLFSELRTRTGMNLMVGNLTNAIQQFTGFSISMVKVKPKHMRDGLWRYTTNPIETAKMISEKSKFMNTRMSSYQFEIHKNIEDMLVNPGKYDKVRDFAKKHGYFLQQGFQSVVDTATWIGAYNQKMEEVNSEVESVRFADSSVRETQGSFAPEDISRFETGSAFTRAFTMFYSYFNMGANLLGTEFVKTIRNTGLREGAGRLLYVYVMGFMMPAVLSEMLVQGLGGFDTGDDDEFEAWDAIQLFFSAQGRTMAAMVPIAGPSLMAGINTWNSKPYDDRVSTSPAVSAIEATLRTPLGLYKAINGEGSWKRTSKDFLTSIGLVAGIPVGQLGKPIGYLLDVQQGKTRPKTGLDVARGLISGKDVNYRK